MFKTSAEDASARFKFQMACYFHITGTILCAVTWERQLRCFKAKPVQFTGKRFVVKLKTFCRKIDASGRLDENQKQNSLFAFRRVNRFARRVSRRSQALKSFAVCVSSLTENAYGLQPQVLRNVRLRKQQIYVFVSARVICYGKWLLIVCSELRIRFIAARPHRIDASYAVRLTRIHTGTREQQKT